MAVDEGTVAFFLIERPLGICEVTFLRDHERKTVTLSGNCRIATANNGNCDHSHLAAARVKRNGGHYPINLSRAVTDEDVKQIEGNPKALREFLLRQQIIEVT